MLLKKEVNPMLIINSNSSDSGGNTLFHQIKEVSPSIRDNWMNSRLDALDGGSRQKRALLKDRIDGIPMELSRKTLIQDIRKIFHRNMLSKSGS
jgi:hypothetical protein